MREDRIIAISYLKYLVYHRKLKKSPNVFKELSIWNSNSNKYLSIISYCEQRCLTITVIIITICIPESKKGTKLLRSYLQSFGCFINHEP